MASEKNKLYICYRCLSVLSRPQMKEASVKGIYFKACQCGCRTFMEGLYVVQFPVIHSGAS